MGRKHNRLQFHNSTPYEISDNVLKNKDVLDKFLSGRNIRRIDFIHILRLVLHIYASGNNESLAEILKIVSSDNFAKNVLNYLSQVDSGKAASNRNIVIEDLTLIVEFFDIYVSELPIDQKNHSDFLHLLERIVSTANDVIGSRKVIDLESQPALIEWVNELIVLFKLKTLSINEGYGEYKSMSLFPNPVDFYEEKNLVPNKLNFSYRSVEEYLDIQFKLYKEDYTSAVRNGMKQYKRELYGAQFDYNAAIRVFKSVTVHSVGISNIMREGIYFLIQFTQEDSKRIRDEEVNNQKMLMNGQLVYFSYTNFTTFIMACIIDGNAVVIDEQEKEHRAIKVCIVGNSPTLIPRGKYSMIEPSAFFEPYYQILRTFQFITISQFPMRKYIVDLCFEYQKPSYLTKASSYIINSEQVDLKNLYYWAPKQKELNDSQFSAFKSALTNEFTLIQGPPGTGKTHLLTKIIETLIANKKYRRSPIFLVCSRNSSLDHVLEPLKKNGHNVLRLGGQTKSELLKECTISNFKFKKSDKRSLIQALKSIKNDLKTKAELSKLDSNDLKRLEVYQKQFINLCEQDDANGILANDIDIIGATTTGAAKAHYMMSLIKPEVVIIEEAAEVLEGHVVASIPLHCQHVILIGDHKQLQPSPADYIFSEKYHMDISLFERLVNNGLTCHTLSVQYRMRPEISSLISPLIYKVLKNHSSVYEYPDIRGIRGNVFFIDHKIPEDNITEQKSHWNKHEADMILALSDYLIKQGYNASDITILAGYSAQVTYFNKAAKRFQNVQGIRISAIDNYQGEENLIILLSLVRSGSSSIGFLKKFNRVNVALSRAKHGLYVIGNMTLLSSQSQLWQNIKGIFKESNSIDVHLPLKCQTHGNISLVKKCHQIMDLRYGGCSLQCNMKLNCGHSCLQQCHPPHVPHQPCMEPCFRIKCDFHKLPCGLMCYEECKPHIIPKVLKCGHTSNLKCDVDINKVKCMELCSRLICPSHKIPCKLRCYEKCSPHIVLTKLGCGHRAYLQCDVDISKVKCLDFCNRLCDRGHKCRALCYQSCPPCEVMIEKQYCFFFVYHVPCHTDD